MTWIPPWLRWWRQGSKPQVGLGSNPPASSYLPQSEAGPQNVSRAHGALPLVGTTVDDAEPKESSRAVDKSMENLELAKDATLERSESLGNPAEVPGQVSLLHSDDAPGQLSEPQGSTTRIPPSDSEHEPHVGASEATARFQALLSEWRQLDHNLDSFTGRLITADDLRREAVRRGGIVIGEVEDILASTEGDALRRLRDTLLGFNQVQTKLQEVDQKLIQQGDQIGHQAERIFGPTAETSFQVLNDQGVVVQSRESSTEDSILSTDDIRLDQTSEARRYLSKKGDVDALRDILVNLHAERIMLSEANEQPDVIEELETRHKEVLAELRRAEEELATLYAELPERNGSISKDQLCPPSEMEQKIASQSDIDHEETGSGLGSPPQSGIQGNSLSQILESTTNDNSIRSTALVNAYLNYQLQQSPREQQSLSEADEVAEQEGGQAQEKDSNNLHLDG
ncbi:hypothetical protein CLAIMM_04900 [Cladophialophora immunda]|nr:hypothetical protein CLAIMM_04900 [Cladophialophora immunda]